MIINQYFGVELVGNMKLRKVKKHYLLMSNQYQESQVTIIGMLVTLMEIEKNVESS